jgi:UDPglucose 6-dehydrogenase
MKIAIVGYGVVGKGMFKLLQSRHELVVYDPQSQPDKKKLKGCELAIICVPTPSNKDGSCDISIIEDCLKWLKTPLVLIKSTVPPGTTEYLRKKYNKKINFSPEYMGESSYYTPFWKYPDPQHAQSHPFVIVGGKEASKILNIFMEVMSVDTKYMSVTSEEAECTKYMENTFFALKVAFCNEWFDIAKKFGVDYKKLRELWLLDPRINPNHTLVFEKRGFGGKCLPKDLKAIIKVVEKKGLNPILLKSVIKSNDNSRN